MNVACPNCQRMLKVPEGAVGRRAKCPACQSKFVVPDPRGAMEATIAGFVLEDVTPDKVAKQRHEQQLAEQERQRLKQSKLG